MLGRIFPKAFDNDYRGHWLGIGLLVPIVLLRTVMGANSIINTRMIAMSADGIALDRFGSEAAQTVLALFALLGLGNLMIGLQGAVVLIRYRAMIPFFYLLLLVQQFASRAILMLNPTGSSSAPAGSALVLALLAMTVVGFVLSLIGGKR